VLLPPKLVLRYELPWPVPTSSGKTICAEFALETDAMVQEYECMGIYTVESWELVFMHHRG
jgi:hypothetical protein